MRHPLLRRQLKRIGVSEGPPPSTEAWEAFLDRVDRTYVEADQDRYTLERSLSTSSAELQKLYEDLRESTDTQIAAQRDELQQTVAIMSATLEAAPDGILVVDEHRRVQAYNRRCAALWRIPEAVLDTRDDDTLLGHVLASLVDPGEFLARVRHLYEHPLESSQEELLLNDGRVFDRYSAPVLSARGECRGRVWFFRDVTARTRAEEELRNTNVFLDSIVENIPDMIFVKDARDLAFERFNRAGEELLGLRRDTLLGRTDRDLFPDEQAEFFLQADRATLASGKVLDIPEEPVHTARGVRWLHTKKIPICDAKGIPKYLLGISADITERKLAQQILKSANEELEQRVAERTAALRKTEEQLRLAHKMEAVGRLAGGVAHDFNNMLAVVVSCAAMLLEEVSQGSPLREDIEEIQKAAQRAASLTQQLLAFSRQQVLQPRVTDLNVVVSDMEKMLRRLIGEDVECVTSLKAGLGNVEVDPGQLQQVIMNLAVNARDAMPVGGRLFIETAGVTLDDAYCAPLEGVAPGPHVVLTFRDTGVGMAAETRARIFEPFFTTKERGRGTGLGLATVYGIVKQSGGHITVDSELGGGSTFRVFLPGVHARATELAPAREPLDRGGRETILLVEDEELVRSAATRILQKKGYRVLEASSPDEAIAIDLRHDRAIDLVVTDVIMPGMNGYDLVGRLSAGRGRVKVIYMSGYSDRVVLDRGPDAAFLQKPFSPAVLLGKVREVLDTKAHC